MSATLGGYIKDLRLQKNISQLEIAFALGWKEPSRLSRIEQGKVGNPPRELIDKLIDAMTLSEEEKNQLLVIGNYLPTAEDIKEARKKIDPIVNNWEFPASSLDYTWRIISANQKLYKALNVSLKEQEGIEKYFPHTIDIIFDPDFSQNKTQNITESKERREFMVKTLMQFQHAQRQRTNEHWYQQLIKHMMGNSVFHDVWLEVRKKMTERPLIADFSKKTIKAKEGKKLNFYFFLTQLFNDPRFYIELYVPKDIETYKYFQGKK